MAPVTKTPERPDRVDAIDAIDHGAVTRGDPSVTPRAFGQALHDMLGDLLLDTVPVSSAADLMVWVARRSELYDLPQNLRSRMRNRLVASLSVYLRHFVLREPWRLIGVDVRAPGAQMDLVWDLPGGEVLVDELKSGAIKAATLRALEVQVGRQLLAGRKLYGASFYGVRTVLLAAPGDSRVFEADGRVRGLDACDKLAAQR